MSEKTLFISQLSENTHLSDLITAFSKYGGVKYTIMQKGEAYIEFDNFSNAKEAQNQMTGKMILDSEIIVEFKNRNYITIILSLF